MRNKFSGGGGVLAGFLPYDHRDDDDDYGDDEPSPSNDELSPGDDDLNRANDLDLYKEKFIKLQSEFLEQWELKKLEYDKFLRHRNIEDKWGRNKEKADSLHDNVMKLVHELVLLEYVYEESKKFRLVDEAFKHQFMEETREHIKRTEKHIDKLKLQNKLNAKMKKPLITINYSKYEDININILADKVKLNIEQKLQAEFLKPVDDSWLAKYEQPKVQSKDLKKKQQPKAKQKQPTEDVKPQEQEVVLLEAAKPDDDDMVGFEPVDHSKPMDLKLDIRQLTELIDDITKLSLLPRPINITKEIISKLRERLDLFDFFLESILSKLSATDKPNLTKQVIDGMLIQSENRIPQNILFNAFIKIKEANCESNYLQRSCKTVRNLDDLKKIEVNIHLCFLLRWWFHLISEEQSSPNDGDLLNRVINLYKEMGGYGNDSNTFNRKGKQIIQIIESDKFKDDKGHLHQIFILDDLIKKIEKTKRIAQINRKPISISYNGLFNIRVSGIEVAGGGRVTRNTRKTNQKRHRISKKKKRR